MPAKKKLIWRIGKKFNCIEKRDSKVKRLGEKYRVCSRMKRGVETPFRNFRMIWLKYVRKIALLRFILEYKKEGLCFLIFLALFGVTRIVCFLCVC